MRGEREERPNYFGYIETIISNQSLEGCGGRYNTQLLLLSKARTVVFRTSRCENSLIGGGSGVGHFEYPPAPSYFNYK